MRSSRPEARAVSLVEVLLAYAILAVLLAPLIGMYTQSHRTGHSAIRRVEVTLHAQMLLEGLAALAPSDLPPREGGAESVLLSDEAAPAPGGGPGFLKVRKWFNKPLPFQMKRNAVAEVLPGGELLLRVDVTW